MKYINELPIELRHENYVRVIIPTSCVPRARIRYFPRTSSVGCVVYLMSSRTGKTWPSSLYTAQEDSRSTHNTVRTSTMKDGATGAADRRPASILEAERRAQRRRGERPERLDRVALELLEDLDVECEYQVALVHDRLLLRVTQLEQVELGVPGEGWG